MHILALFLFFFHFLTMDLLAGNSLSLFDSQRDLIQSFPCECVVVFVSFFLNILSSSETPLPRIYFVQLQYNKNVSFDLSIVDLYHKIFVKSSLLFLVIGKEDMKD